MQQIQLSSEIKADIRNAVSADMEVTTHQQPVNFFGSQSVGYILLDQNTGAGAYRIGGGENGSHLKAAGAVGVVFSSIIAMILTDLSPAAAAMYQATLFFLMIGSIFLLSAYVAIQNGELEVATSLCNAGVAFIAGAFLSVPGLGKTILTAIVTLITTEIAIKGCGTW